MKWKLVWVLMVFTLLFAACGGPKADVSVFMMGSQGIPSDAGDKLKDALQTKLGPAPTIELLSTPMFSVEKMIVEIAAGDHGIIILPEEQFRGLGQQGGFVPLDDLMKPEDYPAGVMEITDQGKTQKHLYGIPLESSKWMKELNFNGKGLYAFIPQNGKNKEQSKQVLKLMAEK